MADSNKKQSTNNRASAGTGRSSAGGRTASGSKGSRTAAGSRSAGTTKSSQSNGRSNQAAGKNNAGTGRSTSGSGKTDASKRVKKEVTLTEMGNREEKKRTSIQPARSGRSNAPDAAYEEKSGRAYGSGKAGEYQDYDNAPVNKTMVDEIVLIAVILLAIIMVLSYCGIAGVFGNVINTVIFGLFGDLGYALPFLLVIFTMFFALNDGRFVSKLRIICSIVLLINLAALIHMIGYGYNEEIGLTEYFTHSCIDYEGVNPTGAGFFGGILVSLLCWLFAPVGAVIIFIAVVLAMLVVITRKAFILYFSKKLSDSAKEKYEEYRISRREQKLYENYGDEDTDYAGDEYPEHPVTQKKLKNNENVNGRRMGSFVVSHGKPEKKADKNSQNDMNNRTDRNYNGGRPEEAYGAADEPEYYENNSEVYKDANEYIVEGYENEELPFDMEDNNDSNFVSRVSSSAVSDDRRQGNFADEELERKFSNKSSDTVIAERRGKGRHGLTQTIMVSDETPVNGDRHVSLRAGSNENAFFSPEDGEFEYNAKDFEEAERIGNNENVSGYQEKSEKNNAGLKSEVEFEGITHAISAVRTDSSENIRENRRDDVTDNAAESSTGRDSGCENGIEEKIPEDYSVNNGTMSKDAEISEDTQSIRMLAGSSAGYDEAEAGISEKRNGGAESGRAGKSGVRSGSKYSVSSAPSKAKNGDETVRDTSGSVRFTDMDAEPEKTLEKIIPEYVFPPVDFLKKGKSGSGNAFSKENELKETREMLERTFESFGVGVKVTDASVGPTVTRYEILPDQGVKVKQITALGDDIALALAATEIRFEAPIPGKAAVGIEVPNKEKSPVFFGDLIDSEEFRKSKSKLTIAIGKDIGGKLILSDIAGMPHALIAGSTGSGKSVCINALIMSILYKAKPSEVKLIMVDPKRVELVGYNGIPHLLVPVVTDVKKAAGALNWAIAEMDNRYQLFADAMVNNLASYNEQLQHEYEEEGNTGDCPKKLPQIVIIIDELNDLMMTGNAKEVEAAICRLTQLARACGIHVILATQRPSVNVITGTIKANIPTRMAFAVSSLVDSRTIIDQAGAEKLIGKGDMLFYPQGYPKPVRLQGAFVSDSEVKDVVDFIKENSRKVEYSEVVKNHLDNFEEAKSSNTSASSENGAAEKKDDRDEFFEQAGMAIIEKQKASIGMLQRLYRIGFNRSARIMDQLCDAGVVGPEEGTKPRKILMTKQQFEEYLDGSYTEE